MKPEQPPAPAVTAAYRTLVRDIRVKPNRAERRGQQHRNIESTRRPFGWRP